MSKSFEELSSLVKSWASDRKILENGHPTTQALKLVSEVGELCDAILKGDVEETRDAIGDSLVVIVIVSALLGEDPTACLESAYEVIKDRRGYLSANGAFVKEG